MDAQLREQFQKVFLHEEARGSELAERVIANFSQDQIQWVTERPMPERSGNLSASEYDQSKRMLYVTPFRGAFFKPCPGAQGVACCNYMILNLGLQCNMNCSYCYLQSYINSPLLTLYSNIDDAISELEQMAATDPLTGLYNRRHFGRVLDQLYAETQRLDKDLACVMIDLDGYKQLNDSMGHQVGDQLLMLAGRSITANKRTMDIAARYGGDEFVLLLPHASGEEAAAVAQRIREEFFASSAKLLKRENGVTMSIGVGSLKANRPAHADQLVSLADAALYASKEAGRNRISMSTGGAVAA